MFAGAHRFVRLTGWHTAAAVLSVCVLSGCASSRAPRQAEGSGYATRRADLSNAGRTAGVASHVPVVAEKGAASLPTLDENAGLEDYLRYAALNNPGLKAAFSRWKAALERIPQVRSLPDPKFTFGYFIESVETRVGPQERVYKLAQMFPWFGKLRLRGEKAFQASEVLREQYETAKLRLFYDVKDAYYEYYYLGRAIAVVEEHRDLVKYLEEVARIRYKAAAARHPDVIRAQVELGKLEDRLRTLKDLDEPILARLNRALNRPLNSPVPWPRSAPREELSVTEGRMLSWLSDSSPRLRRLQHEIRKQERAIELAEKEYWPDLTLGLTYIETDEAQRSGVSDSGKDPVQAMIGINLPIWLEKRKAGVREAKQRRLAALMQRDEVENSLGSMVKMTYYKFSDADRKIDLYRDTLLPKANQSLKATEAAYRAGNATFLDLIDAERVRLDFTLSYERALAAYNQRLAELEMLVGRTLPRKPSTDIREKASENGEE